MEAHLLEALKLLVSAAAAAGGAWAAVKAELRALRRDVTRHDEDIRELRAQVTLRRF